MSLLRDETLDAAHGVGTGSLREHHDALVAGGARFYASRMSSVARAIDDSTFGERPITLAKPTDLVGLIAEADNVVTY